MGLLREGQVWGKRGLSCLSAQPRSVAWAVSAHTAVEELFRLAFPWQLKSRQAPVGSEERNHSLGRSH